MTRSPLFDYIRCHLFRRLGYYTGPMKLARLGAFSTVKNSCMAPGWCFACAGMAAQPHIDLAIWNFCVQEFPFQLGREINRGLPRHAPNEKTALFLHPEGFNPGPGGGWPWIEKKAAKYPISNNAMFKWNICESMKWHDHSALGFCFQLEANKEFRVPLRNMIITESAAANTAKTILLLQIEACALINVWINVLHY